MHITKPIETFQYKRFTFTPRFHRGVKGSLIKGEAPRLRTNSPATTFQEKLSNFTEIEPRSARISPKKLIQTTLSEVSFADREWALCKREKSAKKSCL